MLTALESAGKVVAYLFEPTTPLLSLAFAAVLVWRRLSDYLVVTFYFALVSIHGALSYFQNIDRFPVAYIGFRTVELTMLGVIAWLLGRRSFVSFPSLAAFAIRALWVLLPLSVVLAIVTVITDPPLTPDRDPRVHLIFSIERAIYTVILTFLLAIGSFAGWFPVRMKQNSARLIIGFLVMHAYRWIFLLAANTHWQWTYWGDFWRSFVYAEVLLYWLFTLKPSGEVAVASTIPRWNPERMNELNGQLNQIHSQLARRGF